MPYTEKYYIEITTLDKMKRDRVFLILKKNIPQSFIKMYKVKAKPELSDIE